MITMNKLVKYMLVLGVAFGMTACVHNLDVTPDDPNSIQYFDQDGVFTKIYSTLATTGQKGPDGDKDIEDLDEGVSAFMRMIFELNEFPSDEGWWIWDGDAGMPDLRVISWSSVNPLISGIYYRFYFDISMCNHFLQYAKADDEKGRAQVAEVRFIRALNYYYLLDMFGSVPFSMEVSDAKKEQYSRQKLYNWLEAELKDLEGTLSEEEFKNLVKTNANYIEWDGIIRALPAERISDYRVDRVAAQLLLARLYLNAEVYTGKAQWAKAEEYADKVINSQYKLHMTSAEGNYSAYQELFMGDNHKYIGGNSGEGILNIYQDGITCQSWGGARFFCSAFRDQGYNYFGISDTWSCFRTSPEFLSKWMDIDDVKMDTIYIVVVDSNDRSKDKEVQRTIAKVQYRGDEFATPKIFKDDRAILVSWKANDKANVLEMNGTVKNGQFYDCWSVPKWTGRYSTQALDAASNISGHSPDWPDTDVPFLRVAEAYLTKAEAMGRQGNWDGAKELINTTVRARANAAPLATMDEETMCDEWSREFYCEGRRRIDLVRFGRFAGPDADNHQYNWEGRGGAKSGAAFVSLEAKYNVFPLPQSDVIVQGLTQTPGY